MYNKRVVGWHYTVDSQSIEHLQNMYSSATYYIMFYHSEYLNLS